MSLNVTSAGLPCCVHPSGYLIEYAAPLLWNTRNTWLSGMSPVAAEAASPDSAPGEADPVAAVVLEALGVVVLSPDAEPSEDVEL